TRGPKTTVPEASGGTAAAATGDAGRQLAGAADDLAQEVLVLAAGRRRPRDKVEDLAVLETVIGDLGDTAVGAEIDRQHMLVDDAGVVEGDVALARLRDVVEGLVVE